MNKNILNIVALLIAGTSAALGQTSIEGRVLDGATRQPMEYVNIVLYHEQGDSIITGTVTDGEGQFSLHNVVAGSYRMDCRFMGYETKTLTDLRVRDFRLDLGVIILTPTTIGIGDVVVQGVRPTFTYRIDKKVIEVDQMNTSISGTAADVLVNVPSVTVDIEGNVSLRGSGNFIVLIDGRPSILDAQDALQQIPASTIENIEIITNPSAKYDPEGTAGIINITMKKHRARDWSGLVNGNLGINEKYGGDMLLEHKNGSSSTLLGVDYNNRSSPGTSSGEERYVYQGNTSVIQTSGDMRFLRNTFGLRAGTEFGFGEGGSATINGRYGTRDHQRNSSLQHESWSGSPPQPVSSRNLIHRSRGGNFFSLNAGYQYAFDPEVPGHKVNADVMFRYRDSDELTKSELLAGQELLNGRKTTEAGPSRDIDARLEYVFPFSETNKFEAGYHGEIDFDEEGTTLSEIDSSTREYVQPEQFSNYVRYRDNGHAFYSLYAGELDDFGYQAGMRGEYTLRSIRLARGNEFLIDRWDFFPTLHVSYKFSGDNQLMASYTRRIDRPRGWELEPFETWIDANNVRRGNPSLIPEFIDSYELGAQTLLGQVSLSTEIYHRVNHNKIEDVRSVYSENVSLTTVSNVGTEYSSGIEFLATLDVIRDWNVNLIGNAYDYRIKGILFGESFSTRSFNWSARFNNLIKLGLATQLQVNARWNSPSVSPQGRSEGFVSVDLAAKQEFMSKQLSLTLQIQNVLGTALHEFTSEGPGFYSYSHYKMESPVVMLTARFSINNYPSDRERDGDGGSGDEEF